MDDQIHDTLKSVVETLMKKEATKFRGLIQKELASKVHAKIEELKKILSGSVATGESPKVVKEVGGAMAPSAPPTTTPSADNNVPPPAPTKPLAAKDTKVTPTGGGGSKDDVSMDPNFEKEFYMNSYEYKGQRVVIKQIGTGYGKPIRVYINDKQWEFFPGPSSATKATKNYIDGLVRDIKKNPELNKGETSPVTTDKNKHWKK